jgi:hypothetical protein
MLTKNEQPVDSTFDSEVIAWAGSAKAAEQWAGVIERLAEAAADNDETGYVCVPLEEDLDILFMSTVSVLNEMGVVPPKKFPANLKKAVANEDCELSWELLYDNPHAYLISRMYEALTDVYGFYVAYVDELIDTNNAFEGVWENIYPCLLHLAAGKLEEVDLKFAPKFHEFHLKIRRDYAKWMLRLKKHAISAGKPLREEIMDLAFARHGYLGHTAERESLGFNDNHLHPDMYMNELIVGSRILHQILPKIVEKLGIEIELDDADLRIQR